MSAPVLILDRFTKWSADFDIKKWNQFLLSSNIIIKARTQECYYPKHWTTLSIKCAFNGSEYYLKDGCRYRVDDMRFMLMNFGDIYESYIDSDTMVESFTIFFNPSFVNKAITSIISSDDKLLDDHTVFTSDTSALNFIKKLHRYEGNFSQKLLEIKNSETPETEDINSSLSELLNMMLYSQKEVNDKIAKISKVKASTKFEIYKRLERAKDIIDSGYNDKITVSQTATEVCMNEFHFIREFRKHYKQTPHQYISASRIENAKKLLETTDKPVTEIALGLGFEYLSSFTKMFTKKVRISPEKYRSQFYKKTLN